MISLPLLLPLIIPSVQAFYVQTSRRRVPTAIFETNDLTRRKVLSLPTIIGISALLSAETAQARGLVQFPCDEPLGNTYHFMRAGQSLLDQEDIWSTNPLFVTNREAALSETGIAQVEETVQLLKANNINPSIIRYAIAASSTDTSNIVARELRVGRDKMVPEFNYLEPRAIGAWDMTSLTSTERAVWAMDASEAGRDGLGGRPPPNEDGTPHERLADVAVRLRQLISVLETQYSGDAVLVVAGDGTTLALLSCMMAGIPFDHVHELEYKPGEVRLNVTMDSTLAFWKERQSSGLADYNKFIEEGKVELKRLREMKDIVSLKDQRLEEEQREMEIIYQQEQTEKRRVETEERTARQERAKQIAAEPTTVPPTAAFGVGLGLVAAAVIANGSDDGPERAALDTTPTPKDEPPNDPIDDVPLMRRQETILTPPREERVFDPKFDSPQKSSNPLPWIAPSISVTEVNVDAIELKEPAIAGPTMTAEQAMEDYLNQDDGREGWLQIMSDLLDEDDDMEVE